MKCCKCGVETSQPVSASYPGASVYCPDCGVCGHCGASVVDFVFMEQAGVWMCSCGGHKKRAPQNVTRMPLFETEKDKKRLAWI